MFLQLLYYYNNFMLFPITWYRIACITSNFPPACLFAPGDALDYVLKTAFSEAAGARKDFPKVLVIITDGKSEDPVEIYARQLRSRGVEIFVLGT